MNALTPFALPPTQYNLRRLVAEKGRVYVSCVFFRKEHSSKVELNQEHALALIQDGIVEGRINPVDAESLKAAYLPMVERLLASFQKRALRPASGRDEASPRHGKQFCVALAGPPGSGKSTLSEIASVVLRQLAHLRVAQFSLDDLYLSRQAREELAHNLHPLFTRRGPPGTHDVSLGLATLRALTDAEPDTEVPLPRFDKNRDEPRPLSEWPLIQGAPNIVLVDSWLWNVRPPSDHDLEPPLNETERVHDPDKIWRRAASRFLAQDYPPLFEAVDEWVLFEVPNWDAVVRFREQQERTNWRHLSDEEFQQVARSRPPIREFLEPFQRWGHLPQTRPPDHRIVVDEEHRAQLVHSGS